MLPLHFFKNMSFTGANIAMTLVFFSMMGIFYSLSQFLQSVQGYTPLQSGVRLLPVAVVAFLSAIISARIADRIGTKFTVAFGIFITAIGLFYFAHIVAVDVSYASIAIPLCIAALGMGLTMSPATNSIMGSVPVRQSGVASAMSSTTRQLGAVLGVAVLGTIINSTYIAKIDAVNWPAQLPSQALEAIRSSIQGAHIVAQQVSVPQLSQMIIDQSNDAFTSGSGQAMLIGAIIMVVSTVLTLFILPSQVRHYQED